MLDSWLYCQVQPGGAFEFRELISMKNMQNIIVTGVACFECKRLYVKGSHTKCVPVCYWHQIKISISKKPLHSSYLFSCTRKGNRPHDKVLLFHSSTTFLCMGTPHESWQRESIDYMWVDNFYQGISKYDHLKPQLSVLLVPLHTSSCMPCNNV